MQTGQGLQSRYGGVCGDKSSIVYFSIKTYVVRSYKKRFVVTPLMSAMAYNFMKN